MKKLNYIFILLIVLLGCKEDDNTPFLGLVESEIYFDSNEYSKKLIISNSGDQDLNWNSTKSHEWIILNDSSGIVGGNSSLEIDILIDRKLMSENGIVEGYVFINSNGGSNGIKIIVSNDRSNNRIAFIDYDYNLKSINTDGTLSSYVYGGDFRYLNVAPNGYNIVTSFYDSGTGNYKIVKVNEDKSNYYSLTNGTYNDSYPNWSFDAQSIVFVRYVNAIGSDQIMFMEFDGSNVTQLTDYESYKAYPTCNVDNSQIVYADKTDYYEDFELVVVNSDGKNLKYLTNNSYEDIEPNFSFDGSKIVFTRFVDGDYEIFTMNSDGTNEQQITDNEGIADRHPQFGKNNDILFISNRDSKYNIFQMNQYGENVRQVTVEGAINAGWAKY